MWKDNNMPTVFIAFRHRVDYFKLVIFLRNDSHAHTETSDLLGSIRPNRNKNNDCLFQWEDGPLINAMKNGNYFLLDEISLAEDAVLERLNSLLEPERSILLAEKAEHNINRITASDSFRIFATMNPGNDFGKRELSPALCNRLTEIWVPRYEDRDDLELIIKDRIFSNPCKEWFNSPTYINKIMNFIEYYQDNYKNINIISIRDIFIWIDFIKLFEESDFKYSYIQGLNLILLDGFGLGMGISLVEVERQKNEIIKFLGQEIFNDIGLETNLNENHSEIIETPNFRINPFVIEYGRDTREDIIFTFKSITTKLNLFRILRACQFNKPILLEGSPGVGKTSIIENLGRKTGHKVIRICLSEQTEMADLIGTDLPTCKF